jgi:glycosyltransferase involved in cell wall biosynthesis
VKIMVVLGCGDFNPLQLGGGGRGARFLCEGLVASGHTVRVVMPSIMWERRRSAFDELRAEGAHVRADGTSGGLFGSPISFCVNGVEVEAVTDPYALLDCVRARIREHEPDRVLLTNESSAVVEEAVVMTASSPPYYLAHDVFTLPFGPHVGYGHNPDRQRVWKKFAGVLAVSDFVADCIRTHGGGVPVAVARLPVYGSGPFPHYDNFDDGLVTLVNPCPYKGLGIFLELARTMPTVRFGAVAGWETGASDLPTLKNLPNVRLLEPHPDIDRVLRQTRVLLLPSLVHEGFPLIVNEAMLRGIPVIASAVGGAPEAMHGNDYVIPVNPITRWQVDERCGPYPEIPEQDVSPWRAVLQELLRDRALYDRQSKAARESALAFVSSLSVRPFETFMGLR